MKENTRTCAVCRKKYKFCNKCKEDLNKPLWYFSFCSETCHDIYDITSKFENNQIDANEANVELSKINLSKVDNFGESYKNSINKIRKTVLVIEVEPNGIDETIDDTVVENVIKEEKVLKKSKNRRTKDNVEE